MYTLESFDGIDGENLSDINFNFVNAAPEVEKMGITKSAFRYTRDWKTRFILECDDVSIALENFDNAISFGSSFLEGKFLCLSQTYSSDDRTILKFGPTSEPLLFGRPCQVKEACAVILNGPLVFFNQRGLEWEANGVNYKYQPFSSVQSQIKDKESISGKVIPTGLLTARFEEKYAVDYSSAWKEIWRASKVLTFASGNGVGVGHVECRGDETEHFWLLGFSKFDRFPRPSNWFDIEMENEFGFFAKAYHEFLDSEPSNLPLTYSSDFYRASNSSRDTSLSLALISSFSALEILVHHILREHAKWSADLLQRGKFADRARACAAFIKLQSDPLEQAIGLKEFSYQNNGIDGFTILSEARNSIIHSEKKSFARNGFELVELWVMCQWLVEVFTFYLVGYRGKMADRRRLTGWRGEGTKEVPIKLP
ncbi:MAG: hypothetical protein HLUCCA05_04330 [Roseibaca calidilacus]|uniref:ApeA N-terminal domain-containing protein n=1 Tax=Roseibaca calidilacus TaxID=1666912 RepID=A0A0P7W7K1_9RHOB|nr:hypothetical protein [Roseibaca calidilacus]KPP95906.1 MAG: hypothetical protein HLUCCA05_04330 [Roseibaca calidilacus]CUX81513.1 hypothetical protein Ga0058931_1808 [Roseibaca calidilacus]